MATAKKRTTAKSSSSKSTAPAFATVEDGRLIISLPMQTPQPSSSGKTLVVASTRGNITTDVEVNGESVIVGVNAYIRK